MKKKFKLKFKYDIDDYQAGTIHELELTQAECDGLTRRGCVFASEDAKLTNKKEVVKEKSSDKIIEDIKPEKELDDVDNKKSKQKAKIQAKRTLEE